MSIAGEPHLGCLFDPEQTAGEVSASILSYGTLSHRAQWPTAIR